MNEIIIFEQQRKLLKSDFILLKKFDESSLIKMDEAISNDPGSRVAAITGYHFNSDDISKISYINMYIFPRGCILSPLDKCSGDLMRPVSKVNNGNLVCIWKLLHTVP